MAGMPDIALFAPILLPILGAGALLFLGAGNRYRVRDPLPTLIAGAVFTLTLLLPDYASADVEVLPWLDVRIFGSQFAIRIDEFSLPFIFGLTLLGIAATIVGAQMSGRNWAMAILLWGGSLCMILAANPLTLLASWILCELALIGASLLTREPHLLIYRLVAGGLGAVVFLLLARDAEAQPMANLQMVLAGLSPRWLALFLAAGAVRMGLYPLHVTGFTHSDAPLAPLVLGRISSAVAGLYLWFRGLPALLDSLPADYLVIWGGIAVLICAIAAWGTRSTRTLFPWMVGFELAIFSIGLGVTASPTSIIPALEMINLVLAGSVFGLSLYAINGAEGQLARGWARALSLLAIASLLGLPPTPGFVARWGLYRSAIETGGMAAILPVAVSTGLLVPVLFDAVRKKRYWPARWQSNYPIAGLTVLGLPLAVVSAQPLLLTPVLDLVTDIASYPTMIQLIRAAGSRISLLVMTLILVPVLAGYSLDRVHARWRTDRQLDSLWSLLSLQWLYDLLSSTVLRAAVAVLILLSFLELGSTVGWVMIAGLIVILFVLRR